ncbi:T-lymphoma invasion and metastasis-inducing protein 1 [Madurella mycetomatis]|uniref:T-lymphoma invasion and metastasis-inducing protein 1 n=1 Tax=Madurella mycetomatis TaxID=100816 RepID=A0A175VVB3_9PEZI|nr:T-lymphoma invasion and metastasis-inducing protein 1 [Madurella mycetomatis]
MVLAGTDARPPSLPPPLTNSSHDVQQLGRDITPSAAASDSRSLPAGSPDASLDEDIFVSDEEGPCQEGIEDQCALDDSFPMPAEDAVMGDRGFENPGVPSQRDGQADLDHGQLVTGSAKPFQKWVRTLHKRAARRQEMLDGGEDPSTCVWETDGNCPPTPGLAHRRQSSSESSFGFVTAVKSASISMTNVSVLTRSQKDTLLSFRGQTRTDRSSRASVRGPHMSQDSFLLDRQITTDPAVTERSLQRRRILEELIDTEESYIGDLRFLMNVYVTILASLPNTPPGLRSSVNRNLNDIVELHEEILGELRRVVPRLEYTRLDTPLEQAEYKPPTSGRQCWRSLDAVSESRDGVIWPRDVTGMMSEPQTAAEVAKIFLKKMSRFFIYEEYGAKYELMVRDVASAHRTIPGWLSYQKGLEALAASLVSADGQADQSRKSLTISDLIVKPIQRVCKYPLLFSELLKHTPVVDCPCSHMEIESTLIRLREATVEINRATDNSRVRSVLEKTRILQDRLLFPDQPLDATSKNRIRSFGHIQLCGALHVCWQTKEGANGQYMVALLYRDWLCLATASKSDQTYTIQACIALATIKLEEVDNGRGIQCHTAQHSWKVVFLCDQQLHELILTACTDKEEMEWRTRLKRYQEAAAAHGQDQIQPAAFNTLSLNAKALGTVFRRPGAIARRMSIHRATTVGPKTPLCQVILKNTSAVKEASTPSHGSRINRSQSLLTTNNRIPVLVPSRAERARLETLLADIWTRDVLPFPGMPARSKSEQLVRASASSVMRRLSSVSILKRSPSLASAHQKGSAGRGGAEEKTIWTREVPPRVTPPPREKEETCQASLSAPPSIRSPAPADSACSLRLSLQRSNVSETSSTTGELRKESHCSTPKGSPAKVSSHSQ